MTFYRLELHTNLLQVGTKSGLAVTVEVDPRNYSGKAAAIPCAISPVPSSNVTAIRSDTNHHLYVPTTLPASRIQSNHTIAGRHILSVDIFNKELLHEIFNLAHTFRADVTNKRPVHHILAVSYSGSVKIYSENDAPVCFLLTA